MRVPHPGGPSEALPEPGGHRPDGPVVDQGEPEGDLRALRPRGRRRSWVRRLVAALLVLGPAGYFAVSALQSHDAAAAGRVRAETAGPVKGTPPAGLIRLYRVPIPPGATAGMFFESNAWRSDTLYVRFTTTSGGLQGFLDEISAADGTGPAQLVSGVGTAPDPTGKVGWSFGPEHRWATLVVHGGVDRSSTAPRHRVTVDLDDPRHPVVYVVATVAFGGRPTASSST